MSRKQALKCSRCFFEDLMESGEEIGKRFMESRSLLLKLSVARRLGFHI